MKNFCKDKVIYLDINISPFFFEEKKNFSHSYRYILEGFQRKLFIEIDKAYARHFLSMLNNVAV